MSSLTVLQYPHKGLREIAQPVTTLDGAMQKTIDAMFAHMYEEGLVGLAATQINFPFRFFVMDVSRHQDEGIVFINPEIIHKVGVGISEEGCGSFPGAYAKVKRAAQITVRYQDRDGQQQTKEFENLGAFCVQHEIEHLDGILFIDHLSKLKQHFILKKLEKKVISL